MSLSNDEKLELDKHIRDSYWYPTEKNRVIDAYIYSNYQIQAVINAKKFTTKNYHQIRKMLIAEKVYRKKRGE